VWSRESLSIMRQWWLVPGPEGGEPQLRDVDRPVPGPAEVLVEVKGSAINRGELLARGAMATSNPSARPAPSGIEFAGSVVECGPEVIGWSIGDRVMGRGRACHAEFTVADAAALMPIPGSLSFESAAAVPNVFVTAHDAMVTEAEVQGGESVLITAGSSGVGTAAIQIARHLGASSIVATTRSPAKADALRRLGATEVIDTTDGAWVERVRDLTGGVDLVIDQVGGDLFEAALRTMAIRGRYVTVGRNGGKRAAIDLDLVARLRLTLIGVTFRTRTNAEALACSQRFTADLLGAFEDGTLSPVVDRTFPLDELTEAHAYMGSDRQVGKIVLVP